MSARAREPLSLIISLSSYAPRRQGLDVGSLGSWLKLGITGATVKGRRSRGCTPFSYISTSNSCTPRDTEGLNRLGRGNARTWWKIGKGACPTRIDGNTIISSILYGTPSRASKIKTGIRFADWAGYKDETVSIMHARGPVLWKRMLCER